MCDSWFVRLAMCVQTTVINVVGDRRCPYTVTGLHEPNLILKDNDMKYKLRLPLDTSVTLLHQLTLDAEFLTRLGIMDYSLLSTFLYYLQCLMLLVYNSFVTI